MSNETTPIPPSEITRMLLQARDEVKNQKFGNPTEKIYWEQGYYDGLVAEYKRHLSPSAAPSAGWVRAGKNTLPEIKTWCWVVEDAAKGPRITQAYIGSRGEWRGRDAHYLCFHVTYWKILIQPDLPSPSPPKAGRVEQSPK